MKTDLLQIINSIAGKALVICCGAACTLVSTFAGIIFNDLRNDVKDIKVQVTESQKQSIEIDKSVLRNEGRLKQLYHLHSINYD